ncbi:hypothetical protein BASA61_001923 [Batrachochytrium salamandrivorans]|nr:hypothetical protein BASA60_004859 [Batrachochytrium salamandrivorans]KAH6601544.1 hypothetical protein BASA61_001923 [Batrachochytrium salamandrivorans]KAH9275858.1 hypothetical protein BASA83_001663 [Batrachochytrium salamandrivorans]
MQFFHLFSFVVVASYAAAFPQPAELSEKYSNNADITLASGLEARSYQPVVDTQKDSATLVSLERRGNSQGSLGGNGESSTFLQSIISEFREPIVVSKLGCGALASMIEQVGDDLDDAPEDVKAVGAAIGGDTGDKLVEYFRKALYVSGKLKDWAEDIPEEMVALIKSNLSDEEYSEVESSLKEAYDELTANASEYLDGATDDLSDIEEEVDSANQEMKEIHGLFECTFNAYRIYFEVLQRQLNRFEEGEDICELLSYADTNLVNFSNSQQELYDEITQGLEAAPSE